MKFLYSKSSVYSTRTFLYNYNDNDFRIVTIKSCKNSGFEEVGKSEKFIDYNSQEVQRCSLSRTKKNIRELALCNNFNYFCTLTINSLKSDRYTLDTVQTNLKKILHKIKRKNTDFAYLIITEKHKDGAFHFHGLIKGITDLYTNENGYLSSKIFTDELGFNSFSPIKDYTKCCNYITKYITKDCIKNTHNQIYISSRGLKKATREEFSFINYTPTFTNDYVNICDFRLTDLTDEEKLYFLSLGEGKKNFLSNIIHGSEKKFNTLQ